jgi:hypothetical protein
MANDGPREPQRSTGTASAVGRGPHLAAYLLHSPLTDITIGAYTTATLLAIAGAASLAEASLAKGWWLAVLVGLLASVPTGASGLIAYLPSLATARPDRP